VLSYQFPVTIVDDLSMRVRNDLSRYTRNPENDQQLNHHSGLDRRGGLLGEVIEPGSCS